MKKIFFIFIIIIIFLSFNNKVSAGNFKIVSVVTKDSVNISIDCPLCEQQTPGYIKITNTSGSVGNQQKNFTSLKGNIIFNNLQLGSTYGVKAVATDSNKPFYCDPNCKAIVSSSFKVPLNQAVSQDPTSSNTTPLKVNIQKSGTMVTISVTCNNQCNGLRGSATVTGDGYNKTSPTEKNFTIGIPTVYTFNGLEAGKTYSVSGKPYLPNGSFYTWGTSFTMDSINTGPETVNADIPVDVNPQTQVDLSGDGTYTLLAPIGGITEIKTTGGTCPGNPGISNGIGCYLNIIFILGIGLCGVLAVIMIVIGGIQYMGDESVFGKTEAKSKILSAVLGLFIALGAYVLLKTINPALTGQNGVMVDQVSVNIVPLYDRGATDRKTATGESIYCTPVTKPGSPCTVANLTPVFGAKNAVAMSKICNMESGGIKNAISHTDWCSPSHIPFSFGLFQENLLANGSVAGPDCVGLFDKKTGPVGIAPKFTSGFSCNLLPNKQTIYNTCKNRLLDPTTNLAIAKKLFFDAEGINNWKGDKRFCASAFN